MANIGNDPTFIFKKTFPNLKRNHTDHGTTHFFIIRGDWTISKIVVNYAEIMCATITFETYKEAEPDGNY